MHENVRMKIGKPTLVLITVALVVLTVLGVGIVVAKPETASSVGALATVIAAAGTLVTVLLSTLSNREAAAAARAAEETAAMSRKSEAMLELPALRAQKKIWAKEFQTLGDTTYEPEYINAGKRLDQASARELELMRILGPIPRDTSESIWDELP